jgi:hypothetical protein
VVRVKLCGMMGREDVAMAEEAGADAVGFVTEYPVPVPWNLTVREASALVSNVSPFITTVAVVGGSPEQMVGIALKVRPKVLQLHGDETLEGIRLVVEELKDTGMYRDAPGLGHGREGGRIHGSAPDPGGGAVLGKRFRSRRKGETIRCGCHQRCGGWTGDQEPP